MKHTRRKVLAGTAAIPVAAALGGLHFPQATAQTSLRGGPQTAYLLVTLDDVAEAYMRFPGVTPNFTAFLNELLTTLIKYGFCADGFCAPARLTLFRGVNEKVHQANRDTTGDLSRYIAASANHSPFLHVRAMAQGVKSFGSGKNGHMGEPWFFSPGGAGATTTYTPYYNRFTYKTLGDFNPPDWSAYALTTEPGFNVTPFDTMVAEELLAMIAQAPQGPVMFSLGLQAGHEPYIVDSAWLSETEGKYTIYNNAAPASFEAELPPSVVSMLRGPQLIFQDFYRDDWIEAAGSRETIQHFYMSNLWNADRQFGRVLDALRSTYQEVYVVVVSDQGYDLGELMGHWGKRAGLGQTPEVPFYLHDPTGELYDGTTITRPISTLDYAPTVADMMGVTPDPSWMGRPIRDTTTRPVEFYWWDAQSDGGRVAFNGPTGNVKVMLLNNAGNGDICDAGVIIDSALDPFDNRWDELLAMFGVPCP